MSWSTDDLCFKFTKIQISEDFIAEAPGQVITVLYIKSAGGGGGGVWEWKFFQMFLFCWPRWLSRPYMLQTLLESSSAEPRDWKFENQYKGLMAKGPLV